MRRSHPHHIIGTHSRGEGRSNTPAYQCVSTAQPLFKIPFQKKATLAKRKKIPSLTLVPTSSLPQHPNRKMRGGGIARHFN